MNNNSTFSQIGADAAAVSCGVASLAGAALSGAEDMLNNLKNKAPTSKGEFVSQQEYGAFVTMVQQLRDENRQLKLRIELLEKAISDDK